MENLEKRKEAERVVEKLFQNVERPFLVTSDLEREENITQQGAYKRLSRFHELGVIEKKKVGAAAVVWYRPQ